VRSWCVAALLAVAVVESSFAGDYDPKRDPEQDLRQAVKAAESGGKRILVIVGGEWCGWCKILDGFVKENADVARLWGEHFITVHVNFSPENANAAFLSRFPAIEGYPHIFVLEKDGRLLHSQETDALESGRSYSKEKVTHFLRAWIP